MSTKYYECNFQYDDVHNKNIIYIESNIIHSLICFLRSFHNSLNNEAYDFKQWKFDMKINDTTEKNITSTTFVIMMQ